jgi:hypothetical protein
MSVQVEQSNSKELFGKIEMCNGQKKITVKFTACDGEIIYLENLHEDSMLLDVYRAIPEKHRKKYLKIGNSILDPFVRKCRTCHLLRTVKNAFTVYHIFDFGRTEKYAFSCHDGIFEVSY